MEACHELIEVNDAGKGANGGAVEETVEGVEEELQGDDECGTRKRVRWRALWQGDRSLIEAFVKRTPPEDVEGGNAYA